MDIGDSLILQRCCFSFLLSLLLSPFGFCQQGHQAEELEKGLKFAVLAVSWCVPSLLYSVMAEHHAGAGPSQPDGCSWCLCAQGRHGRGKGLKRAGQKLVPM